MTAPLINTLRKKIWRSLPLQIKIFLKRSFQRLTNSDVEWHFGDLRVWIAENARNADNSFVAQESYNRLLGASNGGRVAKIAIISPTPPAETGIATYTVETYCRSGYEVDIYSIFETVESYLETVYSNLIVNSRCNIYSLNTLPYGKKLNAYQALVFTLGNSSHILPYLLSLAKMDHGTAGIPIFVHLHDPVVLNLLRLVCERRYHPFQDELEKIYGPLEDSEKADIKRQDYRRLIARGICGAEALFGALPIEGIFVNSDAAAKILARDHAVCENPGPAIPVERVFNPVFPSTLKTKTFDGQSRIRIGTFGIPGRGKGTDIIVKAFKLLRYEIPDAELVIAGFDARYFAKHHDLKVTDGILVINSPTNTELEKAMSSCHLAVQLRTVNTGESSGIVPQLLANDVPTIVTDIGAFSEYGDAVAYLPPDAEPETLAKMMLDELRFSGQRDDAVRRYVEECDATQFCEQLFKLSARLSPMEQIV